MARLPRISATASDMAVGVSIPGVDLDLLAELTGLIEADYRVGQISQITVPVLDRDNRLAEALAEGHLTTDDGYIFKIAAQDREYRADGVLLTLTARSHLGQFLRNDKGPRATKGVTPQDWISRRVKAAGGKAVVQPGAKRRQIVQKRGQSALAVIESLSGDMGTQWTEHSNTLFVGTGWWALNGGPGLPTWEMPLDSEAVMAFASRNSESDSTNSGTASLTVPNEVARQLKPWHRLDVSKAAKADNGIWLVEGVSHDLYRGPGEIELTRPRKSSVQKGSSSTASDGPGGMYEGYAGEWVPGADKVWRGCNQTPRQMVKRAYNYIGKSMYSGECMKFISVLAHDPYIGGPYYAKDAWYNMPANTPHGTSHDAPAGSVVVWSGPNRAGHIAIAVGGGQMITTTGGAIQKMPIGGYIGWGYYLGWMAPNF